MPRHQKAQGDATLNNVGLLESDMVVMNGGTRWANNHSSP